MFAKKLNISFYTLLLPFRCSIFFGNAFSASSGLNWVIFGHIYRIWNKSFVQGPFYVPGSSANFNFKRKISPKAIGCQWVFVFVWPLIPPIDPNLLKFWGMIPLGVQMVLGWNSSFDQPFAGKWKKTTTILAIILFITSIFSYLIYPSLNYNDALAHFLGCYYANRKVDGLNPS